MSVFYDGTTAVSPYTMSPYIEGWWCAACNQWHSHFTACWRTPGFTWQPTWTVPLPSCEHCYCKDVPGYDDHKKCCKCEQRMHRNFIR